MQTKPPSSFCARAVIAAALALGSTTAFAQDLAPAPDIPTVAPPAPVAAPAAAAPAPQVITQSNPVVQQVPATPEPAAAPARAAPTRTAARAQPAPREAVRTAPAAAAALPAATPVAAAPIVAPPPVPVAQTPVMEPAPVAATQPQPADDGLTGAEAGMLALLAAAGLAGAGLLAARSRRKRNDEVIEDYEPAATVLTPEPAPVFVREPSLERFAQPTNAPTRPAPAMAGPAPAGDARRALLDRMVAAEPDEENPYVSRKRRVRRARMILAQREQQQASRGGDSFDWRTYRPSTRPAEAAPKVAAQEELPVPYPT